MRHHTNDLSFERPDYLIDRTHHMFPVGAQGASPFNIVLSRTPIADETLPEMADRVIRDLGATLEQFVAGPRQPATIADRAAMIIHFDWTQNGQRLYQQQPLLIQELPSRSVSDPMAATSASRPRRVKRRPRPAGRQSMPNRPRRDGLLATSTSSTRR